MSINAAHVLLTPAWHVLRPHKDQDEVWRSTARFKALACGRGSGKTELARRNIVRQLGLARRRSNSHDPALFFFALPTQAQAKRVAWDKLKSLIPSSWLARRNGISESDKVIKTEWDAQLHLVGMDRPERIEGNQWHGGVLDESCDQKPGAFVRSVRPALSHHVGWCWRIGACKRFGPGAPEFRAFWERAMSPDSGDDYAAWNWSSETVLTEAEIVDAKENLDSRDYDEQYRAIWQGVSGLVFYGFDAVENVSDRAMYDPGKRVIVGSDFNVDPMAWVFMHYHQDLDEFHVFDELWMRNTNTLAALNETFRRYGGHQSGFLFIGDATSRSRNTRASATDYTLIKNDKRFLRSVVKYPRSNPARADRFASCNAYLHNALDKRRVLINPKCAHLIHDLDSRAYAEGTREPDDHDDIGHITDAFGYPIHALRPLSVSTDSDSLEEVIIQ